MNQNDFSKLSANALAELKLLGKLVTHPRGTVLLRSGTSLNCDNTYYILSGRVLIYVNYNELGEKCLIDYLAPGDFFGEFPFFTQNFLRSATAETNDKCELLLIENKKMHKLFSENQEIQRYLCAQLAMRLKMTTQRMYAMCFFDVEHRLMHYLWTTVSRYLPKPNSTTAKDDIKPVTLHMSRKEIGQAIGCTRETASKTLRRLEKKGYLETDGKSITIFDPVQMISVNFETDMVRVWMS